MIRMAYVYRRKGRLFVRAWSKTEEGLWREDGPCSVLRSEASWQEVGLAVESALGGSRQGVHHPPRAAWGEVSAPLLEAAGVKTWATFARLASALSIAHEDSTLRLEPMVRDARGYLPAKEREVLVPYPSDSGGLGRVVLEALDRAD